MKRVLLPLLFMMTAAAWTESQAQEVTYLYNNVVYGTDDTIQCTLGHGMMLELEGFAVTNNSNRPVELTYTVEFIEGADISVGGICTTGGQCTSGNTSAPFTVEGNSTYDDLSLEMIVPETVTEGATATFRITALPTGVPVGMDPDAYGYTYLRIRCNTHGIQHATARTKWMHVYPNPATEHIVIETGAIPAGSTFHVYNASGQRVLSRPVDAAATLTVNTCGWAAGTYLCQIVSQGNVVAVTELVKKP